jgi:hypothetical protein
LRTFLRRTPLEILASVLMRFGHLDDTARRIFSSYDEFLGMLSNQEVRNRLKSLSPDHDQSDEIFRQIRELSHAFRDGLLELFFDEKLSDLTKTYGVF